MMNKTTAILASGLLAFTLAPVSAAVMKNVNVDSKGVANAFGLSGDHSFVAQKAQFKNETTGTHKAKLGLSYKGVKVYGTHAVGEFNTRGAMIGAQGALNGFDGIMTFPRISQEYAVEALKAQFGLTEVDNVNVELVIDAASKKLMFKVDVLALGEAPTRPFGMVNAITGKIERSHDMLAHAKPGSGGGSGTAYDATGPGGNTKTGQYYYGSDYGTMSVTESNGTCVMENDNVRTMNLNHSTRVGRRDGPHSFDCPENTHKSINGAYSPLNDAHYFGNVIFDMFDTWYGIAPLTQKLEMRVHYSNNYQNAFWDGTAMTFGDGGSTFFPLVSLDVSAHEVSHGVTEQNSGLVYSGESGGMNEAFSDMAGEAAENFMHGTNDWMVGAEIFKANGALRYLNNPTQDGSSIDHASDMYSNLDVHYSSGVYNHAFYNLARTAGWTVQSAFGVMLRANQLYWTSGSSFNAGACGVESAAADLGLSVSAVTAAFADVGVACQ